MLSNEPLVLTIAKGVAEERQHGCHYAEGACNECIGIALAALDKAMPESANPVERGLLLYRIMWGR